ncbi:hypothetical protein [Paenibacillus sp. Soil750]|uniref:hypothetical protein n=1 Tax=Paenibacillus sp. Soil750 TaxID=1736398 RepID=UPI0006F60A02|nr:hypothetical protein [Paenibacillus sp. Soil750]KRE59695.1 hypothetical protein ASL11_26085 [Paenibacillus sp. Soil750]
MKKIAIKCSIVILGLMCGLLPLLPMQASASVSVKASLPYFPIQINGQDMDIAHSQYPFLVYKDITYLPMTWNNFQTLGIEYNWSESDGLQIWSNRNFPPPIRQTPLEQDLTTKSHANSYFVQVSDVPITMNQVEINNKTEPYPFLTYQDVTYMPLTWRFVHDLLQIDIQWSDDEGLSLVGGQNAIYSIIGDDDRSLYFYSLLSADRTKSMLKMDKSNYQIEWKNNEEQDQFIKSLSTSPHPFAGKPVELVRKDRDLFYGNVKVHTLTDSDVWESAAWGAPVHTYTAFPVGDQRVILSINLTLPIAAIGPNYGTTYTFLIQNGNVTRLEDFNQKLDRVIPNPDGTVWIASAKLPSRNGFISGSARVGLLDQEGTLHMVNERLHELDVNTLGITNLSLSNPASTDGSLYIVLNGISNKDYAVQDTAGLYTLNTKLETKRLSDYVFGDYYLDKNRNIFIKHRNNTIENLTTGEMRTWFDYDLAKMK